jgi:hypothetical protein
MADLIIVQVLDGDDGERILAEFEQRTGLFSGRTPRCPLVRVPRRRTSRPDAD